MSDELARRQLRSAKQDLVIPKIVCLCGSTRFMDDFLHVNQELRCKGYITFHPIFMLEGPPDHAGEALGVKEVLHFAYKRMIDLSDEVFVINVNGYIGESTRSEIDYALSIGVPVVYLEERDGK